MATHLFDDPEALLQFDPVGAGGDPDYVQKARKRSRRAGRVAMDPAVGRQHIASKPEKDQVETEAVGCLEVAEAFGLPPGVPSYRMLGQAMTTRQLMEKKANRSSNPRIVASNPLTATESWSTREESASEEVPAGTKKVVLKRSVAVGRSILQNKWAQVGLAAPFVPIRRDVVSSPKENCPCHLSFHPYHTKGFPNEDEGYRYPLTVRSSLEIKALNRVGRLDPAYQTQEAIPAFWCLNDGGVKENGDRKGCTYQYAGHFRCVRFEHKGKTRRGWNALYLEFAFVYFDEMLSQSLSEWAARCSSESESDSQALGL